MASAALSAFATRGRITPFKNPELEITKYSTTKSTRTAPSAIPSLRPQLKLDLGRDIGPKLFATWLNCYRISSPSESQSGEAPALAPHVRTPYANRTSGPGCTRFSRALHYPANRLTPVSDRL